MTDFNDNNQDISTVENTAESTTNATSTIDSDVVSGVEVAKSGKGKIIAIIVAIVLLLFGGCLSAYSFIPQVKNTVKMLINSPEEYYAWVESENTSVLTEWIEEFETQQELGGNSVINLNLDNQGIESLIKENAGSTLAEAGITLPANLTIEQKSMEIDGYNAVNQKVTADGKDLFTYNCYLKDGKLYYQIPEFSSSYVCMDFAEIMEMSMAENSNEASAEVEQILNSIMVKAANGEEILSNEELSTLITKYSDILFENIKNVKLEKNVNCEAGGVKNEYTKLVANIDEGTLFEFLKDALKELKNDEIVIRFVEENLEMTKEEYQTFIDEAIEKTSKYELSGGEEVLVMNVFVDNKGEIIGRTFEAKEAEETIVLLGYSVVNNGDNYGISAFIEEDGEKYTIDGKLTANDEKYTGSINVADMVNIDLKDFTIKDDKFIEGEVMLGLSALELDDMTMVFDEKDGKQLFNMDVTYGGTKLGSISSESGTEKPESITVFNEQSKVYGYAEIEQYTSEINVEKVAKNLCDVLGMDEATAEQFIQGFNSGFNGVAVPEVIEPTYSDEELEELLIEEYTPDEDPYASSTTSYDISSVKIQLDGKDIKLPGKIDGLTDKVKFESETIAADSYDYGFDDDYNITVSIHNTTDKAVKPDECEIVGLDISEDAGIKLSVDGITFGDDIQKVVDKYGCKLDDNNSGFVDIESDDELDYSYITFFYMDGKIYEIDLTF